MLQSFWSSWKDRYAVVPQELMGLHHVKWEPSERA